MHYIIKLKINLKRIMNQFTVASALENIKFLLVFDACNYDIYVHEF